MKNDKKELKELKDEQLEQVNGGIFTAPDTPKPHNTVQIPKLTDEFGAVLEVVGMTSCLESANVAGNNLNDGKNEPNLRTPNP